MQTFILPAQAPVGRYLKITLHGKVQQQFEDRQYYTAIRRVNAWGQCLPSAAMFRASQLISTRQLQLSKILNLPATMYTQLQRYTASARYGCPAYLAYASLLQTSCALLCLYLFAYDKQRLSADCQNAVLGSAGMECLAESMMQLQV